MKLANGDVFVGTFVRSAMHGKATYTFANGDVFEGQYDNGVRIGGVIAEKEGGGEFVASFNSHGELEKLQEKSTGAAIDFDIDGRIDGDGWKDGTGTILLPSGDKYTGTIKDGMKNGKGILENSIGDRWEGNWENNALEGEGRMILKHVRELGPHHHGWHYVGAFSHGKFHGFGELHYDIDGGKYTGHWLEGLRQGLGHEEIGSEVYEGSFSDDLRHGLGVLQTKNARYTGHFVRGFMVDDDATVEYDDGGTFRGAVHDIARHGEGRMRYPNGDVYDGEFNNDERSGVGVLTRINGDVYQGQWLNDCMHGSGTMKFSDGSMYEGRMCKGVKHGRGILRDGSSGEIYKVVYHNNSVTQKMLM
jgi:hypothetical protein